MKCHIEFVSNYHVFFRKPTDIFVSFIYKMPRYNPFIYLFKGLEVFKSNLCRSTKIQLN